MVKRKFFYRADVKKSIIGGNVVDTAVGVVGGILAKHGSFEDTKTTSHEELNGAGDACVLLKKQ